ncbi:FAD binding domain-containing protein [Glonium stellatum]|uniref:FAD binding domain-containing protein n=1 Tax=Glonium stellatum TaxID=574774 RepID=A0A8E2F968_9PEZI|nr:FAD binding domain-containing protein [Glonium stellatum]
MCSLPIVLLLLHLSRNVYAFNFPYESIQLTETDVQNHSEIAFPDQFHGPSFSNASCKTYAGDTNWPSPEKWEAFNATLGGALIKPVPLGLVCYSGPTYDAQKCAATLVSFSNSSLHTNDPASIVAQWLEGNTCLPMLNTTNKTCTTGGYPAYVVNATTVKHVQLAVNFARNANLRLIIKNTGHDFLGKSIGGGALSIWTHNLKAFEYLPSFQVGDYTGRAARVGAGLQSFDLSGYMANGNFTIVAPGGSTVGAYGGFAQGGGHSGFTSMYGLVADQILSLQVVTADGKFITVDPDNNDDLFFALRGGGGGVFGVVTSAIVKAYPVTPISLVPLEFDTFSRNTSRISNDIFWKGIDVYHKHVTRICDAKGIGYNFIRPIKLPFSNSTSYVFTTSLELPKMNATEALAFATPLVADLNKVGINIPTPIAVYISRSVGVRYPGDDISNIVGNSRLATRLFPRENLEDPDLFNATMKVIRSLVEEGGYTFHGINYSPTEEVSGYPDSAINPAFRKTVLHAEAYEGVPATGTPDVITTRHDRFNQYFQPLRDVSPGAGSYMNEADVSEPDWQQSFYGYHYPRLLSIKKRRDPYDLFWVPTGVGSEGWEVRAPGAAPQQDGKLCRVADSLKRKP